MAEKLVLTPEDDGKTHLNIYSQGKTKLGKDLSNFGHFPFVHKEHGAFASVEGYWYWLTRQDERLRHAHGYEAKQLGQSLPEVKRWHSEKFESLIKEALAAKLDRNPGMAKALAETTIPLTHYYAKYYDGKLKVTQPRGSDFILAFFEEYRLKHNPEADASTLNKLETQREKANRVKDEEPSQIGFGF